MPSYCFFQGKLVKLFSHQLVLKRRNSGVEFPKGLDGCPFLKQWLHVVGLSSLCIQASPHLSLHFHLWISCFSLAAFLSNDFFKAVVWWRVVELSENEVKECAVDCYSIITWDLRYYSNLAVNPENVLLLSAGPPQPCWEVRNLAL